MTDSDLAVFICTNSWARLSALVSRYSILRNSKKQGKFEIEILNEEDSELLKKFDKSQILWGGKLKTWHYRSALSWAFLRLLPPRIMNYQGRAIVLDPDTLVLGEIYELLTRDMGSFRGLTCPPETVDPTKTSQQASVMLIDCKKVKWDLNTLLEGLVRREYDYLDLMRLKLENNFGSFEQEWNHFDTLNDKTKLLHYTNTLTRPWLTGVPRGTRYRRVFRLRPIRRVTKLLRLPDKLRGLETMYYEENPYPQQRDLWFRYLKECLDRGVITEDFLRKEMQERRLRKDVFEILGQ